MKLLLVSLVAVVRAVFQYSPQSSVVGILLEGRMHCGSAVVHKEYVLTAASCFTKPIAKYSLRIHNLGLKAELDIESVRTHPAYFANAKPHNDVALVRFRWPHSDLVPFNLDFAGISALAPLQVSLLGWGRMDDTPFRSPVFNHMAITLYNAGPCQFRQPGVDLNSELCAGKPNENLATCLVDFGSPLVYSYNGVHTLVGIHSWNEDCRGYNAPSVFVRVSTFANWVESIVDPVAHASRLSFHRYTQKPSPTNWNIPF